MSKNISLVLSGGGTWGTTHLGVLKYLDEVNLKPDEIIGTSFGAIIAAGYGIGLDYLKIREIVDFFSKKHWIKISFHHNQEVLNPQPIKEMLFEIFGNKKLKDFIIPTQIIATNFIDGNTKNFTLKSEPNMLIVDAIMCSISIPGAFSPYFYKKKLYADGGLTCNLPVEFSTCKRTIAVDCMSEKAWKIKEKRSFFNFFPKFNSILADIEKTTIIAIHAQSQEKIKNFKGDLILIKPEVFNAGLISLDGWEKFESLGYKEARKQLEKVNF